MTTQGVPVVDLNDFYDPLKHDAFVQTLGEAITRLGFVRVQGHRLNPETVERIYGLIKRFFFLTAFSLVSVMTAGERLQRPADRAGALPRSARRRLHVAD